MEKYKFKGMKHSVHMYLISRDEKNNCTLENADYAGLIYKAKFDELEKVDE